MFEQFFCCCQKCGENLASSNHINLKVYRGNHFLSNATICPEQGHHELNCVANARIQDGELLDFYCSACGSSLQSLQFANCIELALAHPSGIHFQLIIDRAANSHKSYVITEDLKDRIALHPSELIWPAQAMRAAG